MTLPEEHTSKQIETVVKTKARELHIMVTDELMDRWLRAHAPFE